MLSEVKITDAWISVDEELPKDGIIIKEINPDNQDFKNNPIHQRIIKLMDDYNAVSSLDTLRYVGRYMRRLNEELSKTIDYIDKKQMQLRAYKTLKIVDAALNKFLVKDKTEINF